jgi:thiamine-monophosphate kinase
MAFAPQPAFAPKPEFEFIAALLGEKRSAAASSAMGLGPGDDACLLPQADGTHLAVSTDASVEGVHFRFDWVSPAEALRKAVLSNLSDINAMGGKTTQLYLCLGAPATWGLPEAAALGAVLREMEAEYGFTLAGGDTVRVQQECFFAITVIGKVAGGPLLRSAVKSGDTLYVSGHLGASAAGLQLLLQGGASDDDRSAKARQVVAAHLKPEPPLNLGPALSALSGARSGRSFAAIDLSDGLSSELWHLSRQSACRIEVDWSKLPYDPALAELVGPDRLKDCVLNGGEEYQLVFAGRFSNAELEGLRRIVPVTAIGVALEGEGVYLVDGHSTPSILPAGGYSH